MVKEVKEHFNRFLDLHSHGIVMVMFGVIVGMLIMFVPIIKTGGGFVPKLEDCLRRISVLENKPEIVYLDEECEEADLSGFVTRGEFLEHRHSGMFGKVME